MNKTERANILQGISTLKCNLKENHRTETTHIWFSCYYNCLYCLRECLKKDFSLLNKEGGSGMFGVNVGNYLCD